MEIQLRLFPSVNPLGRYAEISAESHPHDGRIPSIRVSFYGQSFRLDGLTSDFEPLDPVCKALMDRESKLHLGIWEWLNADWSEKRETLQQHLHLTNIHLNGGQQ